jgi:hypothetical protein
LLPQDHGAERGGSGKPKVAKKVKELCEKVGRKGSVQIVMTREYRPRKGGAACWQSQNNGKGKLSDAY